MDIMPTNYAEAQAMAAYAQAQMQNQYPTDADFNEGIVDYLAGNAPSGEFQEFLYANLDREKLYLPDRLDATGSVLGDYVFGLGGAAASDLSRYLVSQDAGGVLDDYARNLVGNDPAKVAQVSADLNAYARFAAKAALPVSGFFTGSAVIGDSLNGNTLDAVEKLGSFGAGIGASWLARSMLPLQIESLIADGWLTAGSRTTALLSGSLATAGAGLMLAGASVYAWHNALELAKQLHSGALQNDYGWFFGKVNEYAGQMIDDLFDGITPWSAVNDTLQSITDSIGNITNDIDWALHNPDAMLGELPDWLYPVSAVQGMAAAYAVGGGGGNTGGISCPLVLDLDGDGVETSKLGWGAAGSHTYFDMDNDGFAERTGWAASGDGLLAIDRNGNGTIDDKSELFGNTETYADGFAALRALDTNADNAITAADADFSNLRVWIDADSDGITDAGELRTLGSLGIARIDLNATELNGVFNNENPVSDRSTFTMNGLTRTIEDVWFRMDQADTQWTGDFDLDVRTLFLPTLKGFGALKDLHVAMSLDPDLLTLVQDFATGWSSARFSEYDSVLDDVRAILYKWAGVEDVPVEDPRVPGTNLDGRDIAFVEKLTGTSNAYIDALVPGVPMGIIPTYVSIGINTAVNKLAAALIFQSGGAELFEDGHYDLAAGDIVPGMVDASKVSDLITQAPPMSGYNTEWSDYWRGVTTFLVASKTLVEFTPDELAAFDGWGPQNQSWLTFAQSIDSALFFGITATGTDFSDQITGTSDRDFLFGDGGDDLIQGLGGTDFISGGTGNDALYGGLGDDALRDEGGTDDLFVGGPGDDQMSDTAGGNDVYLYNPGDGYDVITDVSSNGWTTDIIRFGEGIAKSSITLERVDSWRSLLISVDGAPAIKLYEFFRGSGLYGDYRIERLEFADGSTMDLNVYQDVLGTNGDDVLNGLDRSLLKADHVIGNDGSDTISGGAGNDWLEGGNGNDTLSGGSGDDLIEGGNGNDSLSGNSGNDRLSGGSGADTYYYSSGGGLDTIYDAGFGEDGNVIRFGSGFTAAGIQLVRVGQLDLALESGGMRNILIESQFYNGDSIKTVLFNDGTSIDLTTVSYRLNGTDEGESLVGTDRVSGPDKIYGYGGNDTIYGLAGDDYLIGGAGNDYLNGGYGDDRYIYESGIDTISDNSGNDRIDLGTGITLADLSWERSGSYDLNMLINGALAVQILWQFYYTTIERIRFNDGTYFYLSSLQFTTDGTAGNDTLYGISWGANPDDTINGLGGNDTIYAGLGNDTINGGAGNDTLYGDAGDDVYLVNAGEGVDTISDSAGNDRIIFGAGLNASNMTMTRDGINLNIAFGGVLTTVLQGHFSYNATSQIETLQFSDASTINLLNTTFTQTGTSGSDYLCGYAGKDRLIGNDGNDQLIGYGGNDRLEGGVGNDALYGGTGNDTYVYTTGSDTVYESLNEGTDTVSVGFSPAQVRSWADSNGYFYIQSASNPADILKLSGSLNYTSGSYGLDIGQRVESVSFTDGTIWNLTAGLIVDDTDDAHSLYGSAQADTMDGNGGNDYLYGYDGNDRLEGGSGNDALYGGTGNDTYVYTTGSDTVYESLNEGTDTVSVGFSPAQVRSWADSNGYFYIQSASNPADILKLSGSLNHTAGSYGLDIGQRVESVSFTDGTIWNLTAGLIVDDTDDAHSLYGSAQADTMDGNGGNDYLYGWDGNDRLEGGSGNDALYGGTGNDTYVYTTGSDTVYESLNEGTDTVSVGFSPAQVRSWADSNGYFYIQSASNPADILKLSGSLNHTAGSYGLDIGQRVESVSFTDGTVWNLTAGLIVDDTDDVHSLYGSAQADTMDGNGGNDYLYGWDGADTIYGGNGADRLYGGEGDDRLYGENDNDILYGDAGKDWVRGGAGNDTLYGGEGDDGLVGDAGVDVLYGGEGADKFVFYSDSTFDAVDTIADFSLTQNDKLYVKDLLIGFDPLTKLITDFVQITNSGSNSILSVDRDGTGGAYGMTQIATIQGVTGLTDEAALFSSGNIIAA